MIAIDSSSLVAYFAGDSGNDIQIIEHLFENKIAVFPSLVITELLSDPWLSKSSRSFIEAAPVLPILDGYWKRAGLTRSKLLRRGLKARTTDTLIAQNCLDHNVSLLTRDRDFRNFSKFTKLKLVTW